MQSAASIARALYRITLKRGSPQRLQYSSRLTVSALLALLLLAVAVRGAVFRGDLADVCLYVFTLAVGLYLGTALISRTTSPSRLRLALQATAMLWAAGHLAVLASAALAGLLAWLPPAVAAVAVGLIIAGMINCVQFALGAPRALAVSYTLAFAFAVAAFYATMHMLLAIAMG